MFLISIPSLGIGTEQDSSYVRIPEEVARKVAMELVERDMIREELDSLYVSFNLQKEIISEQDSSIITLNQALLLGNQRIQSYQQELSRADRIQKQLGEQLTRSNTWALSFGCSSVILSVILIFAIGGK